MMSCVQFCACACIMKQNYCDKKHIETKNFFSCDPMASYQDLDTKSAQLFPGSAVHVDVKSPHYFTLLLLLPPHSSIYTFPIT